MRFMGDRSAVIAFEHEWLERVRSAQLFFYHMPHESFELNDSSTGYFVSRRPVAAVFVRRIDDCLSELGRRGVEVRVVNNLWCLHDAVAASTLEFSMIRMRNAAPRRE